MPLSLEEMNTAFKGVFLKAADVPKPQEFVIKDTMMEPVGEEREIKPIVLFESGDKFVINKTNRNAISIVLGTEDPSEWNGKSIILATKKVEFKGDYVPAIRVQVNKPDKDEDVPY